MNLFEKLNGLDDSLVESTEQYELSTLVKDSINHLVNDLGKDPMADDFGDDVCADLENNYDIDVPSDMLKYADWCDAVMSEVSRQLNKVEEQLTEDTEMSTATRTAIENIVAETVQSLEEIHPMLEADLITYTDNYKNYLEEDDSKHAQAELQRLVDTIQVNFIDMINKAINRLNI